MMDEEVEGNAPILTITVGGVNRPTTYEGIDNSVEGKTGFKYSYTVAEGDNGDLLIASIGKNGSLKDKAGRDADLTNVTIDEGYSFVADTRAPEIEKVEYKGVSGNADQTIKGGTVTYEITVSDGEIKDGSQVQLIKTTQTGTSTITTANEGFDVELSGKVITVTID